MMLYLWRHFGTAIYDRTGLVAGEVGAEIKLRIAGGKVAFRDVS